MARAKKSKTVDSSGQTDPSAPLDWQAFLSAAAPVMKTLKADLAARVKASPAVTRALAARHAAEVAERRTADGMLVWQTSFLAQVAAAWLLSCVFVRTLEDRGLLGHNRIAGTGAGDSFKLFLELAPSLNERDYLLTVFKELQRFPATKGLFDARHNPVWLVTPSAEGAKALLQLFAAPRQDEPAFRFGQADTAFLGWIYQDLDEDVRARFALLQTPRFVESFILDRTLEPALDKFGLNDTTLIDPTCGSGHFLLGAFDRLFERRMVAEPDLGVRVAAYKALDAVYGADLNPYAVAIARFRLTLAFFERAGLTRLEGAPVPPLHVVVADSLLHNPYVRQGDLADIAPSSQGWRGEEFALEDEPAAREVLHRQFAAVVGNPPYITVKDSVLRDRYRQLYPRSAAMNYSVAAPFTERFFQLARPGGRMGMITANSFMKREFGKKLIEQYLPTVNLDLVINTSGAYIPGHGTPTVLLFGAHEPARGAEITTVLANRGEPSTPDNPELGLVWRSIADHWSGPDFENEFVSVATTRRETLQKHPWSLGGGGAAELKELLEERADRRLSDLIAVPIGGGVRTGEDEAYSLPEHVARRLGFDKAIWRDLLIGEAVRDWSFGSVDKCIFPYDPENDFRVRNENSTEMRGPCQFLWPLRTRLANRATFQGKMADAGREWFEYMQYTSSGHRSPLSIAFAFVATHNHFVLDRGGKVFKQSAPIIKLPATATEDDHLALLAYLNSSTACFWMKQVFSPKGMHNASESNSTPYLVRYEFDGTKLAKMPLPRDYDKYRDRLAALGRALDSAATQRQAISLEAERDVTAAIADASGRRIALLEHMVALQEEIDWCVYAAFGLCEYEDVAVRDIGRLQLGARPFEVVMPSVEASTEKSWFDWHGTKQKHLDEISDAQQRSSVQRRVNILREANSNLGLLEHPASKRRFVQPSGKAAQSLETDDKVVIDLAEERVANELEATVPHDRLWSVRDMSDELRKRPALEVIVQWMQANGFGLAEFAATNCLPFLAAYRFSSDGGEKHDEWQHVWELQRQEDAGKKVDNIPVPPKYEQADYRSPTYWQLRGPLDVPKERFISYPGCESDHDNEPVYGWAGWDHEQRAKALATLYWNRKTEESWETPRLTPMLAGLLELLPWLKQWHSGPSDDYGGDSAATYYAGFLDSECRALGLTYDDLRAWRPPEKTRGRKAAAPKKSKKSAAEPEDLG